MSEKTYNGWNSYETWLVALWMDNSEGSQSFWQERAEELVKDNDDDKDEATRALADQLKDEHEEANPCTGSDIWADMMNAALSEVDWHEIASHYVDEVEVETEEETEAA